MTTRHDESLSFVFAKLEDMHRVSEILTIISFRTIVTRTIVPTINTTVLKCISVDFSQSKYYDIYFHYIHFLNHFPILKVFHFTLVWVARIDIDVLFS